MIDEILTAVIARVEGLTLELAGVAVPVRKGKQPLQEDQGDEGGAGSFNTQITVSADQLAHTALRFDNYRDLHTYHVSVSYWTPGNRDNLTNLPTLSAWEDAISEAFRAKTAAGLPLAGLRDVRSSPGTFLDRGGFGLGWDVSSVDVQIDLVRQRAA